VHHQTTIREERSPHRFGRAVKLWCVIFSFSLPFRQLIVYPLTLEGDVSRPEGKAWICCSGVWPENQRMGGKPCERSRSIPALCNRVRLIYAPCVILTFHIQFFALNSPVNG